MEFLRSFLRRHSAGKPPVASRYVGCFLRLQESQICKRVLFPCVWPHPSRVVSSSRVASSLVVHAAVLIISRACYIHRSQEIAFRYQGTLIFMLSLCLKVQTDPEEVKQRDLWVTDFIPMQNIYKLALALTSKEIGNLIYQFFCTMYQYRPRRRGTLLFQHLNAYRSFRHK